MIKISTTPHRIEYIYGGSYNGVQFEAIWDRDRGTNIHWVDDVKNVIGNRGLDDINNEIIEYFLKNKDKEL